MHAYPVSFDDTSIAFAYKSDKDLRKAKILFSSMASPLLVYLGMKLTPVAMKLNLPVKGIIRNTIFRQFVGGETLEETANAARLLEKFGVQVILDYGVEGKEGEESFDHSCESFIKVIRYAASQSNMPFISIKVTGIARFSLLEKLDRAASAHSGFSGLVHTEVLDNAEKEEWQRVEQRMEKIVSAAAETKVGVLIDAEESWIQDPVDAITMQMMQKYNGQRTVVYNTIQLYRTDRLEFLKDSYSFAKHHGFVLGVKLVRGAYMEKERKRAAEFGYPSPIQPDKSSSDRDYNEALQFCFDNIGAVSVIVASHNEYSNQFATILMRDRDIQRAHPHVHFSQLFGMSDNITFNLANAGYNVSKYLPFGPINDVIPYLMRRAQENSSVAGQTSRELILINKELQRRAGANAVI